MSSQKNIAISGYYGFENFGDEAILSVLTKELKSCEHNVTVFSKNPALTSSKLKVNSVYTFSLKSVKNTLKNCDVLISGGGSLLQDATSLKSLFYYLFVIYTALRYKKDVIIFAQGIGPLKNPLGRLMTKNLLKKCKYITVRDEKSLFLLRGWDLKPDLVSDPVWNIETKPKVSMQRVGVQLRSWKNLSQKYLFALAREINKNFADKEIHIFSFQDALDLDICKHFEAQLKLVDYLIAMRYHACLLALKYGIPTLALSYDEKVEKIANRFDIPCSFLNDEDKLAQFFERLKTINSKDLLNKAQECRFDFHKILSAIE